MTMAILGGIGVGLLLGSEYSGRNVTILGAILILLSIISIGIYPT